MACVARAGSSIARVVEACRGLLTRVLCDPAVRPLADATAGDQALTVLALSPQMPVAVGPYGQSQPSCFDRVKMGCAVGMAAGGCSAPSPVSGSECGVGS